MEHGFACNFNHIDVVEEILKVQNPKFDIDLCDNRGWTSLYFACEKGYTNIARILLEHHADPHRCNTKGHSSMRKKSREVNIIFQSSSRHHKIEMVFPNYLKSSSQSSSS
jgi:ankyrin repeat protein